MVFLQGNMNMSREVRFSRLFSFEGTTCPKKAESWQIFPLHFKNPRKKALEILQIFCLICFYAYIYKG